MLYQYKLSVPGGDYVLRARHLGEAPPPIDHDTAQVVSFFFTFQIRARDPDAVRAALGLCEELRRFPLHLPGDQRDERFLNELEREIDRAIRSGSIVFEKVEAVVAPRQSASRPAPLPLSVGPLSPPPTTEIDKLPVHFTLSFVDEFGDPVPGLSAEVLFRHDGAKETIPADGNGTARLDKPSGASVAWARLEDQAAANALRDALKPLWDQPTRTQDRRDRIITEADEETSIVRFRSPPLPQTGHRPPESPLLAHDFRLITDEPHRVSVQPHVELVRLIGFYFDTNKCFLLPTAVTALQSIVEIYGRNPNSCVLIVGHTDTSGEDAYNETLSLERAEAMAAFLHDRVDDWIAWYGWDKSDTKRWGAYEDSLMMESLSGRGLELGPNPVLSYQQWHNALRGEERGPNWEPLDEDGNIGTATRAQLIGDYMNHDRTTLDPRVEVTTHGCGEYFPLDETGEQLDPDPKNPERDSMDRRVEVFFFDRELGVQPPATEKVSQRGSVEYLEWRARARLVHRQREGGRVLHVRLHDRGVSPLDVVPYRVTMGTKRIGPRQSKNGWAEVVLPENECPAIVLVEWGSPLEEGDSDYAYRREIVPSCALDPKNNETEAESQTLARGRLQNLGYDCSSDAAFHLAATLFQLDYQIDELGLLEDNSLPPETMEKLKALYSGDCDATTENFAE